MRAIRYYRYVGGGYERIHIPIYYEGPFWAHVICAVCTWIMNSSIDLRHWAEDHHLKRLNESIEVEWHPEIPT